MTTATRVRRILIAAALAVLATASTAHADPAAAGTSTAPSPADLSAARAAADASLDTLGRFFAAGGQEPRGTAAARPYTDTKAARADAAETAAPWLDSATVPVFSLSRAFVADPTTSAPVAPAADLAFFATDAVSASGTHASVWTARVATGAFRVVNIASGSDETSYTLRAGTGATAFEEPQIGAWYALRGGRVLPLNDTATRSVGVHGMSVADYHRLVRSRYADKLPGSAYDHRGMAGGFSPDGVAAQPSRRQASQSTVISLAIGLACVGIGGTGLGLVVHRRVRHIPGAES
jgi:hypothetical protein